MEKKSRMKIGLFGGTFNPIHIGHLRAAEELREILQLEKIYFIPASVPPLKDLKNIASPSHRLRMVEIAIEENPFFQSSDVELKREGPSYTIDTLRFFSSKFPEFELCFILGSELFSEIDSWKEYNKLFELTHFAVITRPGFSKNLLPSLPLALKDDFIYHSDEHNLIVYLHKTSKTLALVQIGGIQVSSTQIRDLIYKNKSIKYLVPKEVERYIFDHNLYKKEAPR